MGYDRSRIMRDAHREWKATKHRPGVTFGKCLALAWAVEKKRAAGREYYQPAMRDWRKEICSGKRDILRVSSSHR